MFYEFVKLELYISYIIKYYIIFLNLFFVVVLREVTNGGKIIAQKLRKLIETVFIGHKSYLHISLG